METNLQRAKYQFKTPENVWSPTTRIQNQRLTPATPQKYSTDKKDNEVTPIRKVWVITYKTYAIFLSTF
jgi:hypothetical protein